VGVGVDETPPPVPRRGAFSDLPASRGRCSAPPAARVQPAVLRRKATTLSVGFRMRSICAARASNASRFSRAELVPVVDPSHAANHVAEAPLRITGGHASAAHEQSPRGRRELPNWAARPSDVFSLREVSSALQPLSGRTCSHAVRLIPSPVGISGAPPWRRKGCLRPEQSLAPARLAFAGPSFEADPR
jgi:hypothetical protein